MASDEVAAGPFGDLDPEEFRRHGHEVVDWIAGFLAAPERYPVLARVKPGDVRGALPGSAPDGPEPLDRILADFERVILPGITHWNHPGFFAYFAISGSAPGILGELLCAALNVNAMLWRTSPAATELEDVVLDWLRKLLDLPAGFRGVIYDTASISTLCALAAAREAAGLDVREQGMAGRADIPRLRVYTSEQAHSSVEKGAIVLGLGREGVRKIPTDAEFRMDDAASARAVAEDRAAGWRPIAVCATVGHNGDDEHRPGAGDRRHRSAGAPLAPCRRRVRRRCGHSARAPGGAGRRAIAPTRSSSTRTSGSSRPLTARPCSAAAPTC